MGAVQSALFDRFQFRRPEGVQEVDIQSANAYRYPPKSGSYFATHFIMGGQRFDSPQPEAYLFGETSDLNFLGNKPVPFPYPAPQPGEPTKTLKSLVNIRKDSLRFIKCTSDDTVSSGGDRASTDPESMYYNVEFTFDSNVKCAITIYYLAREEMRDGLLTYTSREDSLTSETFHYKQGANQVFSQTTHKIYPRLFPDEDWQYNVESEELPVVILCEVEEEEHVGHSHVTLASVEKSADGNDYQLKPLKQKQMIDGLMYLLQEIYGIENKSVTQNKSDNDDTDLEDNGSECVICMCDIRDTLILPCRHLCLCNGCADNLRYQSNNCPICRAPFIALLHLRALKKKQLGVVAGGTQVASDANSETGEVSQEGVPPGYEAVSLIEALNGPTVSSGAGPLPSKDAIPLNTSSPKERHRKKKRSHRPRKQSSTRRDVTTLDETEEVNEEVDLPPMKPPKSPEPLQAETPQEEKTLEVASEGQGQGDFLEIVNETEKKQEAFCEESTTEPVAECELNRHPLMEAPVVLSDPEDSSTDQSAGCMLPGVPVTDTVSLSGTPLNSNSRDGSTYSSCSSTKGLITAKKTDKSDK